MNSLDFLPVDLPGRVIGLLGLSDVISTIASSRRPT